MEGVDDRISLLPDCVLGNIFSLLPVKNAACTIVLSWCCRPIWLSVPLDLDLDAHDLDLRSDGQFISHILSSHGDGPIRRFRATTHADQTTSGWLQTLAQKRIDDSLVLKFAYDAARLLLPCNLLAFSAAALHHLELHWCRLDPQPGAAMPLPSLGHLHLSNVEIFETSLHSMIASCVALRELHLFRVHNLRRLIPSSCTLVDVHIRAHVPLDEVSFRGTPNLENITLLYVDIWRLCPDIITRDSLPPKLRTVCLTLPMLDSPNFAIKPKVDIRCDNIVLNMKFSDGEELRRAANMLSLFPSLQDLRIWCLTYGWKDEDAFGRWQPAADTIICLNKHLKLVQLHGYYGTIGELEFARFLMAGAKALTTMKILYPGRWSNERINSQKDLICKGGKASSEAQVSFQKSKNTANPREVYSYVRKVCIV